MRKRRSVSSLKIGMRQYQPLWNRIKEKGVASVAAPKFLHPRIVKAVSKEKWMDTVFKWQLGENCQIAILTHKSEMNKLTFFLTKSVGLDDL